MIRPIAVVAAASVILGCDIEFTEAPEAAHAPAILRINVTSTTRPHARFAVNITVDPGTDENGVPHPVPNGVLRVLGRDLVPETGVGRNLRYELVLDAPPPDGKVIVDPPVISGIGTVPPRQIIAFPIQDGGSALSLGRGDTLDLRIILPTDTVLWEDESWRLRVFADSIALPSAEIAGRGLPPSSLSVPYSWIGTTRGDNIDATLLRMARYGPSPDNDEYAVQVQMHVELRWRILLKE